MPTPTQTPPETTLHPPETRRNAVIAQQPPMTQYQALRKVNFFSAFDFFIGACLAGVGVTLFFWCVFSRPTLVNVLGLAVVSLILLNVWVVSLVYRCSHYVLVLHAEVMNMPLEAARLVMAGYSGGQRQ
jgi:hypothetical protein